MGTLRGGAPRAVWGTTESDPHLVSAYTAAQRLVTHRTPAHVVWNPVHGEFVQLAAITRPAGGPLSPDLWPDRNTEGRVCVVIQVVGYSLIPFTDGELNGLERLLDWLDGWHIPRRWPGGPPHHPGHHRTGGPSARLWAQGGHFGRSQVPDGRQEGGPGGICPEALLGRPRRPLAEPLGNGVPAFPTPHRPPEVAIASKAPPPVAAGVGA